jgi:hypothetical protein
LIILGSVYLLHSSLLVFIWINKFFIIFIIFYKNK